MHRTILSVTAIILAVILISLFLVYSTAESSIGVKKGYWAEYNVEFTGNTSFGHDVVWAKLEILDIQESVITLNVTTQATNSTFYTDLMTLNLETGQLGDCFIIPANLEKEETFFDKVQGNISITLIEEREIAGMRRTLLSASTNSTKYFWDQETGILVDADSWYPSYTIHTAMENTNAWQPKLFGLNPAVFYALVAGIVVVFAAGITALVMRGRRERLI